MVAWAMRVLLFCTWAMTQQPAVGYHLAADQTVGISGKMPEVPESPEMTTEDQQMVPRDSMSIAARVHKVIKPALFLQAPALSYALFIPLATVGLPPAAGISLLASSMASIGVPFLLQLGGGEPEGAGRPAEDRGTEERAASMLGQEQTGDAVAILEALLQDADDKSQQSQGEIDGLRRELAQALDEAGEGRRAIQRVAELEMANVDLERRSRRLKEQAETDHNAATLEVSLRTKAENLLSESQAEAEGLRRELGNALEQAEEGRLALEQVTKLNMAQVDLRLQNDRLQAEIQTDNNAATLEASLRKETERLLSESQAEAEGLRRELGNALEQAEEGRLALEQVTKLNMAQVDLRLQNDRLQAEDGADAAFSPSAGRRWTGITPGQLDAIYEMLALVAMLVAAGLLIRMIFWRGEAGVPAAEENRATSEGDAPSAAAAPAADPAPDARLRPVRVSPEEDAVSTAVGASSSSPPPSPPLSPALPATSPSSRTQAADAKEAAAKRPVQDVNICSSGAANSASATAEVVSRAAQAKSVRVSPISPSPQSERSPSAAAPAAASAARVKGVSKTASAAVVKPASPLAARGPLRRSITDATLRSRDVPAFLRGGGSLGGDTGVGGGGGDTGVNGGSGVPSLGAANGNVPASLAEPEPVESVATPVSKEVAAAGRKDGAGLRGFSRPAGVPEGPKFNVAKESSSSGSRGGCSGGAARAFGANSNHKSSQDGEGGDSDGGGGGGGDDGTGGGAQSGPLYSRVERALRSSAEEWVPTTKALREAIVKETIKSSPNTMTPAQFCDSEDHLLRLPTDSFEAVHTLAWAVFEKAIAEPTFADMYADLCVRLNERTQQSFSEVIYNEDTDCWLWTAEAGVETQAIGPFDSVAEAMGEAQAQGAELKPTPLPYEMSLVEMKIKNKKFFKFLKGKEPSQMGKYYMVVVDEAVGRHRYRVRNDTLSSEVDARCVATNKTSFRSRLLHLSQAEFEKDDLYGDLNKHERETDFSKMSGQAAEALRAEFEKKRRAKEKRMQGYIQFVGELYNKGVLSENVMKTCVLHLISAEKETFPDKRLKSLKFFSGHEHEGKSEAFGKLLQTIGYTLDSKANAFYMEELFRLVDEIALKETVSARVRFIMRDLTELRERKWVPQCKWAPAKIPKP